jgi:ribosome-associated translation inhibitor RaiA
MNISIKALHQELSANARDLAESKFAALERYVGEKGDAALLECEIEESVAAVRAGARYRVEGNLSVNGKMYRAEAMGDTLEGAVDQVRDDLAGELRRAHGKERGLLRRGGRMVKGWLRF